jgi:hypothetical protein
VKKGGGLSFNSTCPLSQVDEKLVQMILHEYKIFNAEVSFTLFYIQVFKKSSGLVSIFVLNNKCTHKEIGICPDSYAYRPYFKNCEQYFFIDPVHNKIKISYMASHPRLQ